MAMFEDMQGVLKSMDAEMQQEHKVNEETDLGSDNMYKEYNANTCHCPMVYLMLLGSHDYERKQCRIYREI